MKKVLLFVPVVALVMGCQRQELDVDNHLSTSAQKLTFEASFEDSHETRTVTHDGTKVLWSPHEQINIFYGSGSGSCFVSDNETETTSAHFSGVLTAFTGTTEGGDYLSFWGVYPYNADNTCTGESVSVYLPVNQIATEGSFANNTVLEVAKSPGLSLKFQYGCSLFRFTVEGNNVTRVTLRGNNGETLAGRVNVTMASDSGTGTDVPTWSPSTVEGYGSETVSLSAPAGSTLTPYVSYYMAVLDQTLENGLTLLIETTDDQLGVFKYSSAFPFARGIASAITKIDTRATFESLWVDMGDGLEWASMNVGASYSEDYGDLYAWGETVPIAEVYANDPAHEFNSSFVDVATEVFGEGCRMPTLEEWQTLLDETKFEWNWDSQKKGYTVRSLNNNNTIFLPAAGSYGEPEVGYVEVGETGNYWSSTKNPDNSVNYFWFADGYKNTGNWGRSAGCSVRAVRAVSASVPEYVDMGNGMNWATMNLGASSPEEIGDYFAWGETAPKSSYTQDNYNVTEFQDAAAANLGSGWRMPSKDEWAFLVDNCDWEWTSVNGVNGYSVTNNDTGNSIFLPASGRMENSSQIDSDQGWYWTLTKYPTDNTSAYELFFMSGSYRDANNTSDYYYGLPIRPVYDPQPLIDDHEYVDMGDGMLWATCNVGADSPEDYGDYFAWAETEPKDDYSWSEYKYGISGNLTKYKGSDGKTILEAEDDAATANWGDGWRTPTDAEWTWLQENCTWVWKTTDDGYANNGYLVTASNSNTIFLPAAGDRYGTSLYFAGSYGGFWSSSLNEDDSDSARYVYFNSEGVLRSYDDRFLGFSLRPVYMPRIAVESLSLDTQSLSLQDGESAQLSAIISPDNATEQGVIWSSSNESVVTVDVDGKIHAVGGGYATITATTVDGSNLTASCSVEVESRYVEMAPGFFWAKMNVGAESASEPGDLFAWAESTPKTEFTWSNYTHGTSASSLTKYVMDSSYGTVDSKRVLEDADDAVKANWGDGGRIPTASEWQWLLDNCTWTLGYNNGVRGYTVTSNVEGYTSNSIFIPTTSSGTGPNGSTARWGYYWSSTLFRSKTDESGINSSQARSIYISSYNDGEYGFDTLDGYRFRGRSVRAVKGTLPDIRGHAYVDMGNGLKWATMNVGADSPTEYGDYFAWGETKTKSEYSWSTYAHGTSSSSLQTYVTDASYGEVDNIIVLWDWDDAASSNWGGTWRMPTDDEWTWLQNNCTWVWTTENGVNGRKVTSNITGNSIFLPAAGYRGGTSLSNAGSNGYYWSSSLYTGYSSFAWYVSFYSGSVGRNRDYRYSGRSVRPVSE